MELNPGDRPTILSLSTSSSFRARALSPHLYLSWLPRLGRKGPQDSEVEEAPIESDDAAYILLFADFGLKAARQRHNPNVVSEHLRRKRNLLEVHAWCGLDWAFLQGCASACWRGACVHGPACGARGFPKSYPRKCRRCPAYKHASVANKASFAK